MSPKILLADDHSMISIGVRLLCGIALGLTDFHEVTSRRKLLEELPQKLYTHLLLDLVLSDGNSLDILPNIRELYPELHIAIFTVQPANLYFDKVRQYGVRYFINKRASENETTLILSKFFSNDIISSRVRESAIANPFGKIARREMQILLAWLDGKTTKEIATALGVTMSTISTVKAKILEKTNTTNFAELNELARLYKLRP
jgi:DNA-binding NarL/FixJ family response regulator